MASNQGNLRRNPGLIVSFGCLLFLACVTSIIAAVAVFIIIDRSLLPGIELEPTSAQYTNIVTAMPGLNPAPTGTATDRQEPIAVSTPVQEPTTPPLTAVELTPAVVEAPTETPPTATVVITTVPNPNVNFFEVVFPPRDYYESARRLGSADPGSRTIMARAFSLGDTRVFRTDEGDREAELLAITEHAYFWLETSLNANQREIQLAAQQFERDYYPVVTELFGNEWRPGVDNDPHFSILHLDGYADDSELGFFNSGDEYPRSIYSNSNETEMIYLNMANLNIDDPIYQGTLIHEFQHLIQWHQDPNEPIWFSEGLAQFTELYAGLDTVESPLDFLADTSVQLNSWEFQDEDELLAHYGAAYLFTVYIWEQLGEQALVEMVRHPADGLAALYHILPQFEADRSFDQFFADWLVANYLDSDETGTRYGYQALNIARPAHSKVIARSSSETEGDIEPFSAHYIGVDLIGEVSISFIGDQLFRLFPELPVGDTEAWYVPGLNEMDARLTATFDLSDINEADLNFWTWYDLEEGYDFAYLSISTDGGESWDFLVPDHATAGTFGPALSGRSGDEIDQESGWIKESVSLWRYLGEEVIIRFEVMTDSAITGDGFAVTDISVSHYGKVSENEWLAEGFIRSEPNLPHTWVVQLIQEAANPKILPIQLDHNNQGILVADLSEEGGILVVSALTPYIDKPVPYQLTIEKTNE